MNLLKIFYFIDLKVLAVLFSLMIVNAGLQECNIFSKIIQEIEKKNISIRKILLLLVFLPFFTSMIVTNDVALITFVPLSISILNKINLRKMLPIVVIMQTISANIGSSATPIGNPQNLYIFSKYQTPLIDFSFSITPYVIISAILLYIIILSVRIPQNKTLIKSTFSKININKKMCFVYIIIFITTICSVLRFLDYRYSLFVTLILSFIFNKNLIKKVDYQLLLIFIVFFIISGFIRENPICVRIIEKCLSHSIYLTSLITCQFMSNVPTTIILSKFISNWQQLLVSVNIGGLGSPIASFASIISFKFYLKESKDIKNFLFLFLSINIMFIIFLTSLYYILL